MNYYKKIMELKSVFYTEEFDIVFRLISILGENNFNNKFEIYFSFEKENFESNFYNFHKALRQTDFFDNGDLDMIWWNYIYVSESTFKLFKTILFDEIVSISDL